MGTFAKTAAGWRGRREREPFLRACLRRCFFALGVLPQDNLQKAGSGSDSKLIFSVRIPPHFLCGHQTREIDHHEVLCRQVGELAQTVVNNAPMLCLSNLVLTCSPRLLSFHWRARTLPVGCTNVSRECGRRFALVILQRDCARVQRFSSCSLEPLHPTATVCSNPWSLFFSFEFWRPPPLCRHLLEPSCFRSSARIKKRERETPQRSHMQGHVTSLCS